MCLYFACFSPLSTSANLCFSPQPIPYGGSTVGNIHTAQQPIEQLDLTEDDTEHAYYTVSVPASALLAAGV